MHSNSNDFPLALGSLHTKHNFTSPSHTSPRMIHEFKWRRFTHLCFCQSLRECGRVKHIGLAFTYCILRSAHVHGNDRKLDEYSEPTALNIVNAKTFFFSPILCFHVNWSTIAVQPLAQTDWYYGSAFEFMFDSFNTQSPNIIVINFYHNNICSRPINHNHSHFLCCAGRVHLISF